MFLELHIIQNFAPSNLNRDDTGSPKNCEFGGTKRGRISSQAIKRAIRASFKDGLLSETNLSLRSLRIHKEVVDGLVSQGKPLEESSHIVSSVFKDLGLELDQRNAVKDQNLTTAMIFIGNDDISNFTEVCSNHWDNLLDAYPMTTSNTKKASGQQQGSKNNLEELSEALFNGGRAVDLGLFGRMLAARPELNREAASQVAHAISTNEIGDEFDYFTAVDDLNPKESSGAAHLGVIEFNSGCFYRYSNVDIGLLTNNLNGDTDLVQTAIKAFVLASIKSIPTGKQNTFAAQNPPSLVFSVIRNSGFWALHNAFIKPVTPNKDNIVSASIQELNEYWKSVVDMYGPADIESQWVSTTAPDEDVESLRADNKKVSIQELVENTVDSIKTSLLGV
ncbi:type I-E CRISPR-associated protein Cas7/Cse4/CasC [SAR202 cluster bacterium AD-804-J14_MRT_500m]|nr:type I-E CRISPR-associated protein Cas7/Cse4/CasC [SAR202 cluster bacterium AD-804-J14_MRT_500m]